MARITGLERSFFCNSGAEAMETALKIIRARANAIGGGKHGIVALENSFHGRTLGALSITGQEKYRKDFEPLLPGARFVPRNDIRALEAAVDGGTAAIVLELIQGEAGVRLITEDFARAARDLAYRHDALLVFDEIQCGIGRSGAPFAYQLFDPVILPDIVIAAKPMACGIPLGVAVASESAASALKPTMHGSTFGGGPLACRVALEFFDILEELLPAIRVVGVYFRSRLADLMSRFSFIKEVRGQGLMIGVELDIPGKPLVLEGIDRGAPFQLHPRNGSALSAAIHFQGTGSGSRDHEAGEDFPAREALSKVIRRRGVRGGVQSPPRPHASGDGQRVISRAEADAHRAESAEENLPQ